VQAVFFSANNKKCVFHQKENALSLLKAEKGKKNNRRKILQKGKNSFYVEHKKTKKRLLRFFFLQATKKRQHIYSAYKRYMR
jgi:hypothetical protein